MRRFVLGTAGHVDHGKTTLVRALTGVDTDRLPEEKARGISIELGFAPLDLGDGIVASVVDVPGHRRLVRAMIAGAAGFEVVLLCVAADEGVMPQTREHVEVCELLGLDRAVVAVTKLDAVEPDLAAMAGEEARALLGPRWQAEVVPCSARTGEGLDRLRAALRDALMAVSKVDRTRGPVRLGVDRVFSVKGAGTVVTGTLVQGAIETGQAVALVGERGRVETAARALHVHDAAVKRVEAPSRLAVNLAGLPLEAVRRGDVLTSDPRLDATSALDVRVGERHALKRGAAVVAYVGTSSSAAKIDALTSTERGAVARLRLARPVPLVGGDRVVLRGGGAGKAGAVVGGGPVVDARPDRRASGARRRATAGALARGEPDALLAALVDGAAPRPVTRDELESRFEVPVEQLEAAAARAVAAGRVAVAGAGWMPAAALEGLRDAAIEAVKAHHREAPFDRGLPLETLRARLGARAGRVAADAAIEGATTQRDPTRRLVIDGEVARSATHVDRTATADPRLAAVAAALADAGKAGATERALLERTGLPAADLRSIVAALGRAGRCHRLDDLLFADDVLAEARRAVDAHFARAATLSVVELKQAVGFARRQAVLILEHFDRVGLTRRQGDARVRR